MDTPINIKGQCLCKQVSVSAKNVLPHVDTCHCTTCRTWSGTALMAMDCGTEVEIQGLQHVSVFNSSEWAERGFCKHCGTHLFYRLKQNQQYIMPVGLFDIKDKLTFTTQIFIEEKPDYYDYANQTKTMTGEELFAAFAKQ